MRPLGNHLLKQRNFFELRLVINSEHIQQNVFKELRISFLWEMAWKDKIIHAVTFLLCDIMLTNILNVFQKYDCPSNVRNVLSLSILINIIAKYYFSTNVELSNNWGTRNLINDKSFVQKNLFRIGRNVARVSFFVL